MACRDGKVYVIKNGEISDSVFAIESKPVGIVLFEKQILIGGMNNMIYSFYLKGKKNYTIQMPDAIVNMCKMDIRRVQNIQCIIVALQNGEIRLYKDKYLIHTLKNDEVVNSLCYGVFGREEGCLILNHKSGGLSAKIL